MASSVDQLTEGVNALSLKKAASVEVKFAYHVTNVVVTYDEEGNPNNQPQWKKLQWHLADDPTYDGLLFGAPCVFFTTTLYRGDFPTESMYPRYGDMNSEYWFVKVPLTYFNDYHIFYILEFRSQVKLLLVNEEELSMIPDTTRDRMNHVDKRAQADLCLRRDANDPNKYYSNDYNDPKTKYFVNFVVCHNVKLGDGVEWGQMPHKRPMPGKPNNEALIKQLFGDFINRLNQP